MDYFLNSSFWNLLSSSIFSKRNIVLKLEILGLRILRL
ncbi:hypothetical protein LEP1GSC062_4154 [Leptospira alexanderi serovar Manhao 3 str. L 60]|uniref:Uncharacterized protein n=1 Tax=Leptospira alexanderi serovar Manhao 3 str. L 60 TaxID=1049759 RepID=V6HVR5_9LEPT|nr:hypothetical protein LEP1GSC062_4154 [Leptospira alexanderi serovar Manhao 3 str. L 60]